MSVAFPSMLSNSAHQVKMQYLHFRFHANYFLLPWKIAEEISRQLCSRITKGSIYHIRRMYIQPFTTKVVWPEIWCLMKVIYYVLYVQILCFYLGQQNCNHKHFLWPMMLNKKLNKLIYINSWRAEMAFYLKTN